MYANTISKISFCALDKYGEMEMGKLEAINRSDTGMELVQ